MKKINIRLIITTFMICVSSIFGGYSAWAAKRAIAISPTNERILLVPGETFRGGFKVLNPHNMESNLHYQVSIAPFSESGGVGRQDDYGEVNLTDKTNWNQIMDWTTISNPTGEIPPNTEETIEFTIDVPQDVPAGGQYMALLVREDPLYAEDQDDNSLGIKEAMQMAFVVFAEVSGETREEGKILSNDIPSFLLDNKLEATSMVENNGNIHTDAQYTLQVFPLFSDEEICTDEEDDITSFIMPETKKFHKEVCDLPSVGIFKAKQTVKIFGEESIVEKMIIVCPIWLLFIIIFAIAAIIIWIVLRVRNRNKIPRKEQE